MPSTCTSHSPCSLCCNVMLLNLGWLFSQKHFLHSWSNNPPLWFKCSGGCLSVGGDQQLDLHKWFYFCPECMHDFIMRHDKYCIFAFLAFFLCSSVPFLWNLIQMQSAIPWLLLDHASTFCSLRLFEQWQGGPWGLRSVGNSVEVLHPSWAHVVCGLCWMMPVHVG